MNPVGNPQATSKTPLTEFIPSTTATRESQDHGISQELDPRECNGDGDVTMTALWGAQRRRGYSQRKRRLERRGSRRRKRRQKCTAYSGSATATTTADKNNIFSE